MNKRWTHWPFELSFMALSIGSVSYGNACYCNAELTKVFAKRGDITITSKQGQKGGQ